MVPGDTGHCSFQKHYAELPGARTQVTPTIINSKEDRGLVEKGNTPQCFLSGSAFQLPFSLEAGSAEREEAANSSKAHGKVRGTHLARVAPFCGQRIALH